MQERRGEKDGRARKQLFIEEVMSDMIGQDKGKERESFNHSMPVERDAYHCHDARLAWLPNKPLQHCSCESCPLRLLLQASSRSSMLSPFYHN